MYCDLPASIVPASPGSAVQVPANSQGTFSLKRTREPYQPRTVFAGGVSYSESVWTGDRKEEKK